MMCQIWGMIFFLSGGSVIYMEVLQIAMRNGLIISFNSDCSPLSLNMQGKSMLVKGRLIFASYVKKSYRL